MFKRNGKIILIAVLIIQLCTPFTFFIYQKSCDEHLANSKSLIKLNIDRIFISDDKLHIGFDVDDFYDADFNSFTYICFEPTVNGEYSDFTLSDIKPDSENYLYCDIFEELCLIQKLKQLYKRMLTICFMIRATSLKI